MEGSVFRVAKGEIILNGTDLTKLSEREMRYRRGPEVAMIFQDSLAALNPTMKIGPQLIEPLRLHMNLNMKEAWAKAVDLLAKVGIPSPEEPTTALDVTNQHQILELMLELREVTNSGIIFVNHDVGVVSEICDRVIIMYAGRIVEKGRTEDVFENPLHPYTKGLLESTMNLTSDRQEELTAVKGLPPDHSVACHLVE